MKPKTIVLSYTVSVLIGQTTINIEYGISNTDFDVDYKPYIP